MTVCVICMVLVFEQEKAENKNVMSRIDGTGEHLESIYQFQQLLEYADFSVGKFGEDA